MTQFVDHIQGQTFHGRKGAVQNAFRYGVDYVLLDAEAELETPSLFRRNARGIISLHDVDYGGAPKSGRGSVWVRDVLHAHQVSEVGRIDLLTQPRVLGHVFNPVSFWLCHRAGDDDLVAVIAEVTNTFGTRHSYLIHHPDLRAIASTDRMRAQKILHVSPFQPAEGSYEFRFDIAPDRIGIWIDYSHAGGGLIATLTGKRQALSNTSILKMLLRRPFGSRRVLGLIHWQALTLWIKKATFRPAPEPPDHDVSRG